jgi:CheY-like chemotaxis protein
MVDDEEIVLVALRDTLAREGYHVVASPHAIHALTVLKDQQFSVVISDQQMPLISGLEFLTQVREDPAQRHPHPHHRRSHPEHRD